MRKLQKDYERAKATINSFRIFAEMDHFFAKWICWATRAYLVDCPGRPRGALSDLVFKTNDFPPRCIFDSEVFIYAFIVLALFEIIFGGISK